MEFFKGDITNLDDNSYFVFGSNPKGIHGAGSAKIAKDKFGAKILQGRGLQGQSYAIPTKNLHENFVEQISPRKKITYEKIGEKSLSPEQIKENIKEFYKIARQMKDSKFYIAYKNEIRNLNGYSSEDMFDFFTQGFRVPKNIFFSDTFKQMAIDKGVIHINKYNPDKDGVEHINVYTKGKTKLGQLLTNLSDISTTVTVTEEKKTFKSLEGYWYFLKLSYFKNKEYFEFEDYNGFDAKKFGKELLGDLNEEEIEKINVEEFQDLILTAIRNKIYNSDTLKNLLIKNNLPFVHYYYYGEGDNLHVVDLPQYKWMMDEIEKISIELKNNNKPISKKKIILDF